MLILILAVIGLFVGGPIGAIIGAIIGLGAMANKK